MSKRDGVYICGCGNVIEAHTLTLYAQGTGGEVMVPLGPVYCMACSNEKGFAPEMRYEDCQP